MIREIEKMRNYISFIPLSFSQIISSNNLRDWRGGQRGRIEETRNSYRLENVEEICPLTQKQMQNR